MSCFFPRFLIPIRRDWEGFGCSVVPGQRCSMCRWSEAFCWPSVPQRDVQRWGCSEHGVSLLFILEGSLANLTAVAVSWLPTAVVLASPLCSWHVASRPVLAFCQLRILNYCWFSVGWYGWTESSEQAGLLFFTLIHAPLLLLFGKSIQIAWICAIIKIKGWFLWTFCKLLGKRKKHTSYWLLFRRMVAAMQLFLPCCMSLEQMFHCFALNTCRCWAFTVYYHCNFLLVC